MNDKSNPSEKPGNDQARNSEAQRFREGARLIVENSTTVQRLEPAPTRPPKRDQGGGEGDQSKK